MNFDTLQIILFEVPNFILNEMLRIALIYNESSYFCDPS